MEICCYGIINEIVCFIAIKFHLKLCLGAANGPLVRNNTNLNFRPAHTSPLQNPAVEAGYPGIAHPQPGQHQVRDPQPGSPVDQVSGTSRIVVRGEEVSEHVHGGLLVPQTAKGFLHYVRHVVGAAAVPATAVGTFPTH